MDYAKNYLVGRLNKSDVDYYLRELDKLTTFPVAAKFYDYGGNQTKTIGISPALLAAIRFYFENYPTQE